MSATAIAAISALTGLAIEIMRTREQLRQAALASGEITVEELAEQDKAIVDLLASLKGLVGLPPGG